MGDSDPFDVGWIVQINEHDDEYIASHQGTSAHGNSPGDAVDKLYQKLSE